MSSIRKLDEYPLSSRNGTYGGKAGSKEGIVIDNEYYIVKYPQNTANMRGIVASYTTAPLSEYIGSHIYEILGIDTHKTFLGERNGKLVVVCKDFCKEEGSLREIRTLKNIYNNELNEELEKSISSTSDSHLVKMEDILIHLKYNPILKSIEGIKERFWEQIIIDAYINNNDRNNGNWGILYENNKYKIAPVYDNGASFYNKLPDIKLFEYLENNEKFIQSANMSRTAFSYKDNPLMAKDLKIIDNKDFYKIAIKLIPLIKSKQKDVEEFIDNISECFCSKTRKEFYKKSLEYRLEHFLVPVYQNALETNKNKTANCKNQYNIDR